MSLPKIDQPLFEATIPSSQKKIMFRPFLVKEEKLLLIAQASNDTADMIRSIKQVVQNCVQTELNLDQLTTFDLEYLFLKLRARSVNNVVKLSYRDTEDDKLYDFELDLDTIEIVMPENINANIKVSDSIGITMKYPSADITDKMGVFSNEVELMTFFITNCIDTIYDEENVYVLSEYSQEEINEFLDSLSVSAFEKIKEFFETMPRLYHKLTYKNSLGNDREIELTNLRDFFMWG